MTAPDIQRLADRLEVVPHLIEYVYDEYDPDSDDCFELYLADRISEAAYVGWLYNGNEPDEADEYCAEIFAEVLELLDFDLEAHLEAQGLLEV